MTNVVVVVVIIIVCHCDNVHAQLQDTLRVQSSTDSDELVMTTAGEQLTAVTSAAATDTQQTGRTTADTQQVTKTTAVAGKKHKSIGNSPEPDTIDERKSR